MNKDAVVRGSFLYDEREFNAGFRASRIASSRFYDTAAYRWIAIGCGHFFLLIGFLLTGIAIGSGLGFVPRRGSSGPLDVVGLLVLGLVPLALGVGISYCWLYGRRLRMRRLFREFSSANLQVAFAFTPNRLLVNTVKSDSSLDWRLFPDVVDPRRIRPRAAKRGDGVASQVRYGAAVHRGVGGRLPAIEGREVSDDQPRRPEFAPGVSRPWS